MKSRAASKSKIITMRLSPDEDFGHKVTKVSVRSDCFSGGVETLSWEQRKPYDEFDYGYVLTVHKSQGVGMGRCRAVRRELRISGQPRPLALHRNHPRREAAEHRGVVF